MRLESVNVGTSKPIAAKSGQSGIFKDPQAGAIRVGELGLAGDVIIDTKNHGGPDQAVYLYGTPDYDWWAGQLGRDLSPGLFGENLTISDLHSAEIHIGDRFWIGDVHLEVTSPRIPCVTLAARMEDPKFLKAFILAKRPGIYCRVLVGGEITAGSEVVFEAFSGARILATEMLKMPKNPTPEYMHRFLQAPVHRATRADFEAKLAAL